MRVTPMLLTKHVMLFTNMSNRYFLFGYITNSITSYAIVTIRILHLTWNFFLSSTTDPARITTLSSLRVTAVVGYAFNLVSSM